MDELGALVEEGGVVLVGLDHEEGRLAEARRHAEVLGHPPHQETRLEAGIFEDPRQQRGGGGLAVGARHGQHPAPLQHVLGQPLGARYVGQPLVEDGLEERIAAGDRVAHHEDVRLEAELLDAIAFDEADALLLELGAHRRIDVGVAARHLVAGSPRQQCHATHEGAANPENMNVHEIPSAAKTAPQQSCVEWAPF